MGKKGENAEQNYPKQPFLLSVEEIVDHLQTRIESGLSTAQVDQYQDKYGPNKLSGEGGVAWYSILGKQISNAMILVCQATATLQEPFYFLFQSSNED